jgi:hypothetical protein
LNTLLLVCAIVGGVVLLLQVALTMLGIEGHAIDLHTDGDAGEALNLLSVRALAAGLAFFGIAGLAVRAAGLGWWAAIPAAILAGGGAAAGIAALSRSMLRLQSDGSVDLNRAIGEFGTVYLQIPGERAGTGKIHLALQGRTVECQAVSAQESLPSGTRVVVIDTVGPDIVEVAPEPDFERLLND